MALCDSVTASLRHRAIIPTVFRIRIHLIRTRNFRLNPDPDPGFDDQKFKKFLTELFFIHFLG
jgi:hypothetical protein